MIADAPVRKPGVQLLFRGFPDMIVRFRGTIYAVVHNMTHAAPQLKTGELVELIRPITGVPAGTRGIILQRFTFDPFYDVHFDGYAMPRLVNKRDVAPAPLLLPAA